MYQIYKYSLMHERKVILKKVRQIQSLGLRQTQTTSVKSQKSGHHKITTKAPSAHGRQRCYHKPH